MAPLPPEEHLVTEGGPLFALGNFNEYAYGISILPSASAVAARAGRTRRIHRHPGQRCAGSVALRALGNVGGWIQLLVLFKKWPWSCRSAKLAV